MKQYLILPWLLISSNSICWVETKTIHELTRLPHFRIQQIMSELSHIEHEAESGWSAYYHVFPQLIQEYGLKVGVEVGVSTGGHSHAILKTTDVKKLYSIDPWLPNPCLGLSSSDHYNLLYYRVKYRLAQFPDRSEVIRDFSFNVVNRFDDGSLDFAFIDGNHEYPAVKQDLEDWYPKVRSGGIIGGDDYATSWPGVPQAVDEFFAKLGMKINQDKGQPRIWWIQKP